MANLDDLRARYPWPITRPGVEPDLGPVWFLDDDDHGHPRLLRAFVGPQTKVLLELGSFAGRSTRGFLRMCPHAHVIAIDTWKGSPEHQNEPAVAHLLPQLFETFLANLWEHRDRLTAVRETTIQGMQIVHDLGIRPDAVYVDADHSAEAVFEDLACIHRLFPDAQIIGDDWPWASVRAGVKRFARLHGREIKATGGVWWIPRQSSASSLGHHGKVVALTLFQRPDYTRRVIDSLAACDGISEYLVAFHVEPGHPQVLELARHAPFENKRIVENATRLGCGNNVYSALDDAFRFADYAILLEDDVVPAPDCLRYFEWARRRYRDDPQVFSISAYSKLAPPPERYYSVQEVPWFNCWGWATWADRWAEIRAQWDFSPGESWDVRVNRMRGERIQIEPYLARTQNIGAELGTHCPSPQWHRENMFNEFGAWSVDVDLGAEFRET